MSILDAIKHEERKLEKQLHELQKRIGAIRAAGRALGNSAGGEFRGMKKRALSAAARAKMSKAAKRRWAKIRAGAKKAVS